MSNWRPPRTPSERVNRSLESMVPGTLRGRIAQSSPVPDRPRIPVDEGADIEFYVQPDEPIGAGFGAFWWDTDEPVT